MVALKLQRIKTSDFEQALVKEYGASFHLCQTTLFLLGGRVWVVDLLTIHRNFTVEIQFLMDIAITQPTLKNCSLGLGDEQFCQHNSLNSVQASLKIHTD